MPYPFEALRGHRDSETATLVHWLLGRDPTWALERAQPLGGAALVTGFRGVGKTSLVRRAVFEAGVSALYGETRQESSAAHWGPFGKKWLARVVRQNSEAAFNLPVDRTPVLLVPVFVEVSTSIEPEALLRRLLRQLYFTAVRYRLGDFLPDLMRRIRLAYVRTLGEVGHESTERLQQALGITLSKLGELEVSAEQELEFSETFKLTVREISVEEAEDEIIGIGDAFAAGRIAKTRGLFGTSKAIVTGAWEAMGQLAQALRAHGGAKPHLVFVLDELDKLPGAPAQDEPAARLVGQYKESAVYDPTEARKGEAGVRILVPRARGSALATAAEVVARLKVLFSSRNVSAICIAGAVTERDWMEEALDPDPMLRSMFSRRVYVRPAGQAAVASALGSDSSLAERMAGDTTFAARIAFASKGRFKDLFRMMQDGSGEELSFDRVATRLRGWGDGDLASTPPMPIDGAQTLDELALALTRTLSTHRQTQFALDAARSHVSAVTLLAQGAPVAEGAQLVRGWLAALEEAPMFAEGPLLQIASKVAEWSAGPHGKRTVPSTDG